MKQENVAVRELRDSGITFLGNVSDYIDLQKFKADFERDIAEGNVRVPRLPPAKQPILYGKDLNGYQSEMASEASMIDRATFEKGETAYRERVVHVTSKDPLLQYPYLSAFIFSDYILDIARGYLGGDAAVGYIKVKKSFANTLPIRSGNHMFHMDDNTDDLMKVLFYIDDVAPGGGGFQYIPGTHRTLEKDAQYTFTDAQIFEKYDRNGIIEVLGEAGQCVGVDTTGLHKEGTAIHKDRWVVIVNYVLEEEYGGRHGRCKIDAAVVNGLSNRTKSAARYLQAV